MLENTNTNTHTSFSKLKHSPHHRFTFSLLCRNQSFHTNTFQPADLSVLPIFSNVIHTSSRIQSLFWSNMRTNSISPFFWNEKLDTLQCSRSVLCAHTFSHFFSLSPSASCHEPKIIKWVHVKTFRHNRKLHIGHIKKIKNIVTFSWCNGNKQDGTKWKNGSFIRLRRIWIRWKRVRKAVYYASICSNGWT